jgi:hypothetical protein
MTIIIVSGAIANKYLNGGAVWTRLNWILGLQQLGFQVYFVEQIGRNTCVDHQGVVAPFADCLNLAYFRQITGQFGLSGTASLLYEDGEQTEGLSYAELLDLAEAADLLVNISGHLAYEPLLRRLRRKVYVDLDPGFTQFWYATGNPNARLEGHDYYFTIGENVGSPACSIPTKGIRWRPVRQPVVLEQWPVSMEGEHGRFTTVATWRGPYGPVCYDGHYFGLKVHEWRKFVELPEHTQATFEIALDIHPAEERDIELLRHHGWQLAEPRYVAADPDAFRRYVQTSGAEFSVAQGIYSQTGSGWFSDRTVRYLASGKPAVVQDTGFSQNVPVGEGLLAFRTLEEASAGVEQVMSDYDRHSRAARALAEDFFAAEKVLGRLVEEVGIAP